MLDKATRDAAMDRVSYEMTEVLESWMQNEKRNLDGFIASPEEHVDYNPFLIFDIAGLQSRSAMLGSLSKGLSIITGFKKGEPGITRSLHDNAVDHIPSVIWIRLYDWMVGRAESMEVFLRKATSSGSPVPLSDYQGLAGFDAVKYLDELNMYKTSIEGLAIVIEYAKGIEAAAQKEETEAQAPADGGMPDETGPAGPIEEEENS